MFKKIYIIAFCGLLIDQITKLLIDNFMELYSSINIIDSFFSITYIRNTGAAWGMFSNNTILLALISLIFLFFLIKYINDNKNDLTKMSTISFGLIIGGLIGNLIDRLLRRYVIDFFSFNILGYSFPIFNVADILIVIAVFLLIIESFIGDDKNDSRRRKEKNRSIFK